MSKPGFPYFDHTSTMLEAALGYTRFGLHVFPVYGITNGRCACDDPRCPSPGKHPRVSNNLERATTDAGLVREWWARWEDGNIGWALGRDECACVDVDPRNGGDDSFARLERKLGTVETVRALTGGGGEHHIFRVPPGITIPSRIDAFGEAYPGVDVKSDGGFVVLAPSIHATGKRYIRDVGSPAEFAKLPEAWIAALMQTPEAAGNASFITPERISSGARHTIMHKLASSLREKGLSEPEIFAALRVVNRDRCEPPMDDRELATLCQDVARRYVPTHNIFQTNLDERAPTKWVVESAAEIAKRGVPNAAWDIERMLPEEDGPALLFGPPGALKTWLAMHACRCFLSGEQFLGYFNVEKRLHALYVNLDAGKHPFERRVLRLGAKDLLVVSPEGYEPAALREVFATYPGAFIVIDALPDVYRFKRGDDAAESMRNFLRHDIRGLYAEFGCNGLLLDHPHRPRDGAAFGDYYGSAQKEAAARVMWHVTPLPSTGGNVARAKITCRKMSEAEPFAPFVVQVTFSDESVAFTYNGALDESAEVAVEAKDRALCAQVLRGVPGGMSCNELRFRTGLSRERVLAAVKAPDITTVGKGRATRYRLEESAAEADDSPDDLGNEPANRSESSSPPRAEYDSD
jgi:hypothetical protein